MRRREGDNATMRVGVGRCSCAFLYSLVCYDISGFSDGVSGHDGTKASTG